MAPSTGIWDSTWTWGKLPETLKEHVVECSTLILRLTHWHASPLFWVKWGRNDKCTTPSLVYTEKAKISPHLIPSRQLSCCLAPPIPSPIPVSHVLCPSSQAVLQPRHVNIVLCELCMRLLSSRVLKCIGNNPFSSMSEPVEARLPSCTSGTPEEPPEYPKQGCWTVQGSQCWFTRDTSLSHQRLLAMESSH